MLRPPPPSLFSPQVQGFVLLVLVALVVTGTLEQHELSSWFRTREENDAVGGRPDSLHLRGLAMDIVSSASGQARLAQAWQSWGLDALDEGDHVHLELDGPRFR